VTVLLALDELYRGVDFADALHLARSSRAFGFATYGQRLGSAQKGPALVPPVALLG
jgi:hypothetical protein